MTSLRERRKEARLSLFIKRLAEGIEPSFNYNLEKVHKLGRKPTPIHHLLDLMCFTFPSGREL